MVKKIQKPDINHRKRVNGKGKGGVQSNIKTAKDLGIMAQSLGMAKKAKTHKGRKILELRAPKVLENPKKSIVMKGKKSSEILNSLLRELHAMRGTNLSQLLMKKTHDFAPMEDASMIERTSVKYDASLFMVGSHQKKRPHNLVLGRIFDGHVLDMFEFGVEDYKGCDCFHTPDMISKDLKPIMIFQGEPFENSEKHKRIKNLFIDMFKMVDYEEVKVSDLQRVLVFTCKDAASPIEVKHLEVREVSEPLAKKNAVPFREVGPSFSLRCRRDKMAGADNFKEACRKPKTANADRKKANKNKSTNELGETKGKVFVQQQDISTLAVKKFKANKTAIKEKMAQEEAAKAHKQEAHKAAKAAMAEDL